MRSSSTLLACFLFMPASLWAQQAVVQSDTAINGKVKFIQLDTKQHPQPVSNAYGFMKDALKMQTDDSLRLSKVVNDDGRNHYLYQQFYKGYKVQNGTYAVHAHNGVIESANGFFQNVGKPSLQAKVDESSALARALAVVHASRYGWEDAFAQQRYKEVMKDDKATLYPKGELLISRDDSITHSFRLVYKFHVYAVQPLSDENIYVDASTGSIIARESLIMHTNTAGYVSTLYSGYQAVTMDLYNTNQYRLQETRTTNGRTAQIKTLNMQNGGNYAAAIDFSKSTTSWTTGEAGQDVHWGTEKVFDYWATVRSRNSYDNAGATLSGYVHANLPAINPNRYSDNDNAFWDATLLSMTYGDGTTQFNAVVALDVIAHEIGHGICQYTAGLGGLNESPSLNEGLSDIWGAVIEYWVGNSYGTWTIGEQIMKNGQPCLRSLINPKIESNPDTYHGTYWSYTNTSHINCTVLGHWFYLLSQGGTGTNDVGSTYKVLAQGINIAADIVWNAESTGKIQAATQYADMRTATINAATEMYGAGSCQVKAVTDAWYAVGIGAAPPNANLVITGPDTFCGTGTYTVSGVPAGQVVTWTVTPSGFVTLAPNGNSITLTKTSGTDQVLTASLPNCIFTTKSFSTLPKMNLSYHTTGSCSGSWQDWIITASPNMPLSNYVWTSHPSTGSYINIYGGGSSSQVGVSGGGGVDITATDACGETVHDGVTIYAPCPRSLVFSVSPNPSVSTVNIQPRSATDAIAQKVATPPQITTVSIYDQMGGLLRKQRYGNVSNAQINVSGLKVGLYYIEIEYDKTKERQPLVVGEK